MLAFKLQSPHCDSKFQCFFVLWSSAENDIRIFSPNSPFTRFNSVRMGTFSSGLPVFFFVFFLRGSVMTLPELNQRYSSDEDCREILTRLRWPEGVTCPRCKNGNTWWLQSRK